MPFFLNKKLAIILSLSLVLLTLIVDIMQWPWLKRLDYLVYDARLKAFPVEFKDTPPQIVIVKIDEKSLEKEGRWPWPRAKLAKLVEKLSEKKAAVIAFDMVFAEPDKSSDSVFAETLKRHPNVIAGFILHHASEKNIGQLPTAVGAPHWNVIELQGYTSNLPAIQKALSGTGFLTIFPDEDGVIRRAPLLLGYQGKIYPSLALETIRERFTVPQIDENGVVLIPYTDTNHFIHVSATDVLQGKVDVKDAIVIIGTTALGIGDIQPTPIHGNRPGVEIQAHLIAGLLQQNLPVQPVWSAGFNVVVLLLVGVLLSILLPYLGAVGVVVLSSGVFSILLVINLLGWTHDQVALPLATQILLVLTLVMFQLGYGFLGEGRYRRHLKTLFGQYVPPEIIDEMTKHPEASYGFEGESREMTVLFADIKHFTALAESLSPHQTKQLLQQFLTPMTEIIFKHGGTIDKYVGDMMMAFWGAPLPHPQHADRAIEAALEMQELLKHELNPKWVKNGFPPIEIGIGINTGTMNVGDMGSTFRRAYTVLGDAVNIGSRLEQLTRAYQVPLIIGEETQRQQQQYVCRFLDKVVVKGREGATPLDIYQPVCKKSDVTPTLAQSVFEHEAAVNFYLAKDWQKAHEAFELLWKKTSLPVYSVFLEFIKNKP